MNENSARGKGRQPLRTERKRGFITIDSDKTYQREPLQ
jgi:hypothetical protein